MLERIFNGEDEKEKQKAYFHFGTKQLIQVV